MTVNMRRRELLMTTATGLLLAGLPVQGATIRGALPWEPNAGSPPRVVQPGAWLFFSPEEGAAVEALVDRLIPPDPQTPGGKDAGCAVFIDRQLAGPYGESRGLYMRPPFYEDAKGYGPQSPLTPAQRYRHGLAALDKHCRDAYAGKPFAQIPDAEKDAILTRLQKGEMQLEGANGQAFSTSC
jgi:gluconate 2-dehydrogenase gamma chain